MAANEELTARIQAGETEAIAELWEQNLKLVKSTVRRVSGLSERDSGFDDLEQQAFFGFRAAVYAFDPAAGVKFSTYAAKRIEWELCRYYEQNGYTVRLPAYMPAMLRICKALHISRANYDSITGQAIDRLLVLAFGTDGIPWEL